MTLAIQIFSAIAAIFGAIKIFNQWFTKSTEQKQETSAVDIRTQMDEVKKTGRPQ